MKKTIIIDAFILLLTLYLSRIYYTSLVFHQIIGIIVITLVAIHITLNWRNMKQTFLNLKKKEVPLHKKARTIISCLMIITLSIILITGIIINSLVPFYLFGYQTYADLHFFSAYLFFILIGFFIGLSIDDIVETIMNLFNFTKKNIIAGYSVLVIVVFISIFGIRALFKNTIWKALSFSYDDVEIDNTEFGTESISLKSFIKALNCNGCGKNCSLLYPECALGSEKRAKAIETFNTRYETNYYGGPDTMSFFEYFSVITLIAGVTYYTIKIPEFIGRKKETINIKNI